MRRILLLCVLLALAPAALAGPPVESLRQCLKGGIPRGTEGLPALEAACPGLGSTLDELGLSVLLSAQTREHLSADAVADALDLATPAARRAAPDVAPLRAILRSLRDAPQKQSLWTRFVDWLRATFGPRVARSGPNWFSRLLDAIEISEQAGRLLLYALVALVLGAAGWIVYSELKAAGVLARFGVPARGGRSLALAGDAPALDATDLERIPPAERVGALLRLVLDRLAERGRRPIPRSRTHRQLREVIDLDDPDAARRFAALAGVAEEQLYAATPVGDERLGPALADGAALYASLSAARAK